MADQIVHLCGKPHPLKPERREDRIPAGESIGELLHRIGLPHMVWEHVEVDVDGVAVPPGWFARVRPKAGALVSYQVKALDGGVLPSSTMRLLIGTGGQFAGLAASHFIGGPAGAIVGGVLGVGSVLAANVLVPPPPLRLDETGHSLTGARNRWRPYEAVPKVYGRVRTYPDLAAAPWRELAGDDQYLRLLMVIGHGPLALSAPRIGATGLYEWDETHSGVAQGGGARYIDLDAGASATDFSYVSDVIEIVAGTGGGQSAAIEAYDAPNRRAWVEPRWTVIPDSTSEFAIRRNVSRYRDVQYELVGGRPGDAAGSELYPNQVVETDVAQDLLEEEGWHTVATADDTDEISIDLVWPNGLCLRQGEDLRPLSVRYEIQYQPVGPDGTTVSDRWLPHVAVDTFGRNAAAGTTTDRVLEWLEGMLERLEEVEGNLELIFQEDEALAAFPAAIVAQLHGRVTAVRDRMTALQDGGFYGQLSGQQQAVVDDIRAVLDRLGVTWFDPSNGNFVDTAFENVDGRIRDQMDNLLAMMPGVAALVEIHRELAEGRLQDLPNYPWYLRWWLVRTGLWQAAGGREPVHTGTAQAGSADTITLASAASDEDGAYENRLVVLADGTGSGQSRPIEEYTGATRVARVDRDWSVQPDATTVYEIHEGDGHSIETAATTGVHRINHTWRVDRGRYRVRIRRVTPDREGEQFFDLTRWQVLRSVRHEPPIRQDGLAIMAMRVRATEQITGSLDQVSVLAEAELPVWDGSGWATQTTRNPAWAYLDMLRGPGANRRPLADEDIDLESIHEWAQAADAEEFRSADDPEGDPVQAGRRFDLVLRRQGTVFDALRTAAAAGRASFSFREGLYSVVRDLESPPLTQHFTPRNSWGWEWERAFYDEVHAVRVRFENEDADYQADEVVVYAPGFSLDGSGEGTEAATRFETIELPGCTSQWQAYKDGRYWLNARELRPETFRFNADFEHIACRRGDRVRVTHDIPLFGLGAGRITAVQTNGSGHVTHITLDEPVQMETGESYGIRIRASDGSSHAGELVTDEGEQHEVELATPIDPGSHQAPAPGDLAMWGEAGEETVELLVTEIEPRDDLSARITCTPLAPELLAADTEPVEPREPFISLPFSDNPLPPPVPVISAVETEQYVNADSVVSSRIRVTLAPPVVGVASRPRWIQARYFLQPALADIIESLGGFENLGVTWTMLDLQRYVNEAIERGPYIEAPQTEADSNRVFVPGIEENRFYAIRVRYLADNGLASAWAKTDLHTALIEGPVTEAANKITIIEGFLQRVTRPVHVDTSESAPSASETTEQALHEEWIGLAQYLENDGDALLIRLAGAFENPDGAHAAGFRVELNEQDVLDQDSIPDNAEGEEWWVELLAVREDETDQVHCYMRGTFVDYTDPGGYARRIDITLDREEGIELRVFGLNAHTSGWWKQGLTHVLWMPFTLGFGEVPEPEPWEPEQYDSFIVVLDHTDDRGSSGGGGEGGTSVQSQSQQNGPHLGLVEIRPFISVIEYGNRRGTRTTTDGNWEGAFLTVNYRDEEGGDVKQDTFSAPAWRGTMSSYSGANSTNGTNLRRGLLGFNLSSLGEIQLVSVSLTCSWYFAGLIVPETNNLGVVSRYSTDAFPDNTVSAIEAISVSDVTDSNTITVGSGGGSWDAQEDNEQLTWQII